MLEEDIEKSEEKLLLGYFHSQVIQLFIQIHGLQSRKKYYIKTMKMGFNTLRVNNLP